jgi:hypothetical protein
MVRLLGSADVNGSPRVNPGTFGGFFADGYAAL